MVQMYMVVKWSKCVRLSNGLVLEWWSENRTKMSVLWSKMYGFWMVCPITWLDHLKTGQKSVRKVKYVFGFWCSDGLCFFNVYVITLNTNETTNCKRFEFYNFMATKWPDACNLDSSKSGQFLKRKFAQTLNFILRI